MNDGLLLWLLAVNVAAFVMMGLDKAKAKLGAWRIPEKTLLLTAAAGGSVGAILGMQLFRHKTRHAAFAVGLPAILAVQLAVALLLTWQRL